MYFFLLRGTVTMYSHCATTKALCLPVPGTGASAVRNNTFLALSGLLLAILG